MTDPTEPLSDVALAVLPKTTPTGFTYEMPTDCPTLTRLSSWTP